jgi:hypothetical protein
MNHPDTVVIVTSYCGEPNSERKNGKGRRISFGY